MLRWAAVLGAEFSVRNLEAVSGLPARKLRDVVDSAANAGVLARSDGELGFRHGLIRQVLYDGMPGSLRSDLHARAALALAGAGAPAEQVAAQLVPGPGEPDTTAITPPPGWLADWLAGSAVILMRRAPQAAAALLRAALGELAEGDSRRDALEAALVTVSFLLARREDVERFGTALMTRSADPNRVAEMGWLVGYTLLRTGRAHEAGRAVAGILARPGPGGGQRARLTALQAMISSSLGDPGQAAANGEAALAQAGQAGDAIGTGYALHPLSTVANAQRDQVAAVRRSRDRPAARPAVRCRRRGHSWQCGHQPGRRPEHTGPVGHSTCVPVAVHGRGPDLPGPAVGCAGGDRQGRERRWPLGLPGVRSGANYAGAEGPMRFEPATFAQHARSMVITMAA